MSRRIVMVESPFAAIDHSGLWRNIIFARSCAEDALARGEAPFLSHLLYPRIEQAHTGRPLESPFTRARGLDAGRAFLRVVEAVVVYIDRGISPGMAGTIDLAQQAGVPIEYRTLGNAGLEGTA